MRNTIKQHFLKKHKTKIGPLNGVIVLGYCYYASGPLTLQQLVDLGALVIKVEAKPFGDPMRNALGSALYNMMNYGQLSLGVDYENEQDQQLMAYLLEEVIDIIVDNRSLEASLRDKILQQFLQKQQAERKHNTIYCAIRGFPGKESASLPAMDVSVQAMTGMAYTNGSSPEQPLKVGFVLLDEVTALTAVKYILAHLYQLKDDVTISNQLIEIQVFLAGVSIWLQAGQAMQALQGKEPLRHGNDDLFLAPFSFYKAKDGYISLAIASDQQFKVLCEQVLSLNELFEHYPTNQARLLANETLKIKINAVLSAYPVEHWLALCVKHHVPAAPVLLLSQALKQPFAESLQSTTSDGQTIFTDGSTSSLFPVQQAKPAPALDEDRDSIVFTWKLSKL